MRKSAEIIALAVKERARTGGDATPALRTIAQGDGWRVADIVCPAGPQDREAEDQHDYVSIALVVGGAFTYRSSAGSASLQSGSILLGTPGACFHCGHDHGAGDRCIAFQFTPDQFENVLSELGGAAASEQFPLVALPASKPTVSLFAQAEALAAGCDPDAAREAALRIASQVLGILGQAAERARAPTAAQARAIADVVRSVEGDPAHASLEALAARAEMSPFHFIRLFKRVVGMTPHAFVRATRLREAARRLRDPTLSVTRIAFDVGFGDLSAFNTAFRQTFGVTPRVMRRSFRPR